MRKKKQYSPQSKIKLALIGSCLLVFGGAYAFKLWTDRQDRKLAYQYYNERKGLINSVYDSQTRAIRSAVQTVSSWDNTASLAQSGYQSYADNLKLLESLNLSGYWVFNEAQQVVSKSTNPQLWGKSSAPPNLTLNQGAPNELNSYYKLTPKGAQYIVVSRVFRSEAHRKRGDHSGYIVVAKLIDKSQLLSLSKMTDSVAQVSTVANQKTAKGALGAFTVRIPLPAANMKPTAWLDFTANSRQLAHLQEREAVNLMVTALCLGFFVIGFGTFLKRFVTVPKKEFMEAIKTGSSDKLAAQMGATNEMKDIVALVESHSKNNDLQNVNETLEKIVYRRTQELEKSYGELLEALVTALELRDQETEGHSRRVTELTVILAQRMGFSSEDLVHIKRGALLHDIGKIGIPDAILLKCGPLDPLERAIIGRHPEFAGDILKGIEFIAPAMDIPLCHHEKWDGTGYPNGLKGEDIPLSARLFSIVDVWDALSSDRPYRTAWPQSQVRSELERMSGTHFDPRVVSMMLCLMDEGTAEGVRKAA